MHIDRNTKVAMIRLCIIESPVGNVFFHCILCVLFFFFLISFTDTFNLGFGLQAKELLKMKYFSSFS